MMTTSARKRTLIFSWLVILTALASAGCAGIQTYKSTAAGQAAQTMDALRRDATWTLCDALSWGAIKRAAAEDPHWYAGWLSLCWPSVIAAQPTPPIEP